MQQSKKRIAVRRSNADYLAARAYFPRGLVQPGKGCRFSSDALLLGSFLHPEPGMRLLDLGTGSGAVALAMLCRCPSLRVLGVDIQPEYVAAAKTNASRLGFSRRFTALHADIRAMNLPIASDFFDLALTNPPYRQRNQGRLPSNAARLAALFEQPDTLAAFCRCAARTLKPGGRFGIIFPAKRREELLLQLHNAALLPVRVLYVYSYTGGPPRVMLVEAIKTQQKDSHQSTINEHSLILHSDRQSRETSDKTPLFSAAALAFCPFLAG